MNISKKTMFLNITLKIINFLKIQTNRWETQQNRIVYQSVVASQ